MNRHFSVLYLIIGSLLFFSRLPTSAYAATLFQDTFADADNTELHVHNQIWTNQIGSASIYNNQLNFQPGLGTIYYLNGYSRQADQCVSADYNDNGGGFQLLARYQPPSETYYGLVIGGPNWSVVRRLNGPGAALDYNTVTRSAIRNLRLCVIDSNIFGYINGTLVSTVSDSNISYGTGGIFSYDTPSTLTIDNFVYDDAGVPTNASPEISAITVSVNPILVNSTTTISANFTDPDIQDTHTASWNWGDGNTTTGSVTESNGSGSVSDTHTYTSAGVYEITLTITDNHGGTGSQVLQYLSVYSPSPQRLFLVGQKFMSPAGAYVANRALTGNVMFGLSYKYQADVPVSNRQFSMDFNTANFKFNATSISSLVIANGVGTLRGAGTVNGQGTYNFLVVGKEGANSIRIQIKDALGNTVYDTQPGSPNTTDPTTSVTAGNVLAH